MSSYFDLVSGGDTPKRGEVRRGYRTFRRSDRYLLFAELPYATVKVAGSEIQTAASSGAALDAMLDYQNGEVMGFNHKDGKNVTGHVCFADGHVEKFRAPKDKSNIKNLTKWLCRPRDEQRGDFDVSFDGKTYSQDFTAAAEDAE